MHQARKAFELMEKLENRDIKNSVLESDALEREAFEGDAFESDALEREAFEGDAFESDALENEVIEVDAFESNALESDALESEVIEVDAFESNALESDALESEVIEVDAFEGDAFESNALEGDALESEVIEVDAFEGDAFENNALESDATEIHVVLVEPEIPPNTGNIARSCAAVGAVLHLVAPLGFSVADRDVRRAGLDYWPYVKLQMHEDLDSFMKKYSDRIMYFSTTKGEKTYTEVQYPPGCFLVFGKETAGLPKNLIEENRENAIRIPMGKATNLRSLNLSNAVSIVLFEALRQNGFKGLK